MHALVKMTMNKKSGYAFLIGFLMFVSSINLSYAATLSMTISAGEEINQKIDLEEGDHLFLQFSVVGAHDNVISFSIILPDGSEKNFGQTGSFEEQLICDIEGEYILNFVNEDTSESKLVTYNYKIDQYVLGIPKLLFQALVIVVICLAMVSAFILMSPSV
jgi:hypothetical protein